MNAIDLLNLRKAIIGGDARKTVALTKAAIKEERAKGYFRPRN